MTAGSPTPALIGGVALLERAVGYTLGSVRLVTPDSFGNPTPCREWDVCSLLLHLNDSLAALQEAMTDGCIGLVPLIPAGDPVSELRSRAAQLVGAWASTARPQPVRIGGRPLSAGVVAAAGALEIAVHGWDLASGCGRNRPLPAALAAELLDLSHLLVTQADRPIRFAPPVQLAPPAGNSDQLVAFLGRDPR